MSHWKSDLDSLVAETMAFAKSITRSTPRPKEEVDRIGLKPLDYNGNERNEILRRVQNFKAHQQRFAQEREEYAASMLRKMRRTSSE